MLITAFRRVLATNPKARLILAGASEGDPLASHDLTELERSRIQIAGRFVEDGELQIFLRAADIAAYPYTKILTSGSLILALSYGIPCVIPEVGMTSEVLGGRNAGVLFDRNRGVDALEQALRQMLLAKEQGLLAQVSVNAKRVGVTQEWEAFEAVVLR